MAEVKFVKPVKLFCGIIITEATLLGKVRKLLENNYGPIDLESELIDFTFTDYYAAEMGGTLYRKFFSFAKFIDPGDIALIKLKTNAIEKQFSIGEGKNKQRRVNLDPGFVAPDKLVLATTKNFSHRIYLRYGIYAEITLQFRKGGLRFFPWTYPDFKSDKYAVFFLRVRQVVLDNVLSL